MIKNIIVSRNTASVVVAETSKGTPQRPRPLGTAHSGVGGSGEKFLQVRGNRCGPDCPAGCIFTFGPSPILVERGGGLVGILNMMTKRQNEVLDTLLECHTWWNLYGDFW